MAIELSVLEQMVLKDMQQETKPRIKTVQQARDEFIKKMERLSKQKSK